MQPISSSNRTSPVGLLAGIAFGVALFAALVVATSAGAATPSWQPSASERWSSCPAVTSRKPSTATSPSPSWPRPWATPTRTSG